MISDPKARKAIYALGCAVFVVLATFNVITTKQSEALASAMAAFTNLLAYMNVK